MGATDLKPSTWFGGGYAVASHQVQINTNDASANKVLTQITDAQADPTTGDIRRVIFALLEAIVVAANTQSIANNSSDQMIIAKNVTPSGGGNVKYNYAISLNLTPSSTVTIPTE